MKLIINSSNNINSMEQTTGIVVCRNILTLDEQLRLIDIVERKAGLKDSNQQWNFLNKRGRYFGSLVAYPEADFIFLSECSEKFKTVVEQIDPTLVWPPTTHMLTWWYPTSNGMGWHSDSYGGNDGDEGAPVYSLTAPKKYMLLHVF